jgi:hypothetical protein
MARKTSCNECNGTGQVRPFEYAGETHTRCPWCEGTGRVDDTYVVYEHGWNGDWTFREVVDVVNTELQARRLAERVLLKDRYENVLDDGTPTVQWVEVVGVSKIFGVEVVDGRLEWADQ